MKKLYNITFYFFLINICYLQECPPSDTLNVYSNQDLWNIPYNNNWDGLEVMTWNIKEFPQTNNTIEDVQEIITDILPDIINFQELSLSSFNNLATMIPSYSFIKTDYTEGFNYNLQLGIAYRKDCLELLNYTTLFNDNSYPFAHRPPLKAEFLWSCGSVSKTFQMINIHFKCCDDGFDRRLEASGILESYLEEEYNENNFINIIVAGDFNDSLDDPQNNNSLWPLVNSDDLYFVDYDISIGSSQNWSYPSWPSHIDHILINKNLFNEDESSNVLTMKIDNYTGYSYYQNNISDHRPVLWKIIINDQENFSGLVVNEIMNNPLSISDSNGEWFEVVNISNQMIDIYGLIIKDQGSDYHMINEHINIDQSELIVLGSSSDVSINGSIQVDYEYNNFNLGNTWDEIILIDQNENIVDEVYYDYGGYFPNTAGASMALISNDLDNNIGSSWFQSDILMNSGDYGTPGEENSYGCIANGDANLDNQINIVDIVYIVNYILGINNPDDFNDENFCHSDMDQNGILNIVDIVSIIGNILEVIK